MQPAEHPPAGAATDTAPVAAEEQPLRFLLIRSKPGDPSWVIQTIAYFMAPAEVVQVVGMGNALWRLGQERFDSILLDLEITDRAALRRCREQIAELAAVPVLDLRTDGEAALQQVPRNRAAAAPESRPKPQEAGHAGRRQDDDHGRRALRLPWQRRPKRPAPAPTAQPEHAVTA